MQVFVLQQQEHPVQRAHLGIILTLVTVNVHSVPLGNLGGGGFVTTVMLGSIRLGSQQQPATIAPPAVLVM